MGISSSIGLISGVDYGSLVDQLMELNAASRKALETRNNQVKKEQAAVTTLSALLLSVQYVAENLGKTDLYNTRTAASSNDGLATATVTGTPNEGNYQFTVLRTAQQQQFLSSGFKTDSTPIGAGKLTIRYGNNLERTLDSSQINGGDGIARGKIRITDRSGVWADIDLTAAQTIDDVLDAINNSAGINVTAMADGDRIRLIDNTGQTTSNLKVQEVGRGATAASLGLAGIDVAASTAEGEDIVRLTENTLLDRLNEGAGVEISTILADIGYTLADGTTGNIDFSPLKEGETKQLDELTLGDVLEVINNTAPGKLKAEISADGDRLVITDLTEGEGTFSLKNVFGGTALTGLGLSGQTAVGGVITGNRIQGGLKTPLLSSLNGGKGFGALGVIELTDRSGATATVDLAGSETLDDVLNRINSAGLGITAGLNEAKNGIQLVDTTGATASNLIVADGDATGSATKLGIAVNEATTSVGTGDMHLQVVSRNTTLASLNGGAGIARGSFEVTDSTGRSATINLSKATVQTVGDVIEAINNAGIGIVADLNATGDGIRIYDVAQGSGTLKITEGSSTAARDLHLLGKAVTETINGTPTQVIDGAMTTTIELSDDETLASLVKKINAANAGVTAAEFVDGSSTPYRLQLTSKLTGAAGNLVIDASGLSFNLDEIVQGTDALIAMGANTATSSSVLVSSTSNSFTNVVSGLTLNVKQASSSPVTVSVSTSNTNFIASVQTLVTNYNNFRSQLLTATRYDSEANVEGVLTGDSVGLRLDMDLSRLLSQQFTVGDSSIRSLGQLGISFKDDGTLSLDQSKLEKAYAADPKGVETFFTDKERGFSKLLGDVCETLVGQDVSLMAQRYKALQNKIDENAKQLTAWDEKLERQREHLLRSFYNMESAIAKLQSNMDVITRLQTQLEAFHNSTKK